jgi:hypothetical protein
MHPRQVLYLAALAAAALLALPRYILAQDATHLATIAPNLARNQGTDAASGIAFTRLYVSADTPASTTPATAAAPSPTLDLSQPTLTAQCTKRANGKLFFELFVNFGGVTDITFYPPWVRSEGVMFPPATPKLTLTMEFLGYTKVKPVKRQWERVLQPDGQLRYTPPGTDANLEEISYYFQYLRALPTLRITGDGHTVSFLTTALQAQLHKEPLCTASGL